MAYQSHRIMFASAQSSKNTMTQGPFNRVTRLAMFLPLILLLDSPAWAQRLAPVEITPAKRQTIVETVNLTGTLTSPNSAQLAPEVEGQIVELAVDAGHRVATGDVLFRLDDELARLDLQQAVAAEREAETNLRDSERRNAEVKQLVKQRSFPESEARSLAAQVERNRAVLERRRAERARAAELLARHVLRAPYDGVIASRDADLGERVDPDKPVLRLVSVDRLQLDLQVPQKYFRRVGRNTPVDVSVDALPGEKFSSAVAQVVPISDPDARTFLVRAYLDNREVHMTPGMSVRASLRIGTGRQGVVVPRDALIRYPDGRTIVWVVNGEGEQRVVEERLVETGLSFDSHIEIVGGLTQGEPVVVRGNESLRPGQKVRINS